MSAQAKRQWRQARLFSAGECEQHFHKQPRKERPTGNRGFRLSGVAPVVYPPPSSQSRYPNHDADKAKRGTLLREPYPLPSGNIRMNDKQNFIVITGGPGAGKTTLVKALAASGFLAVEEAGRCIIQEQRLRGGTATHDGDRIAFRRLMFEDALQTYQRMADFTGPVFFDRGLPDLIGYSRLIGAPVPSWLQQAVENYRYNETVFIAPAWQEIFRQDDERPPMRRRDIASPNYQDRRSRNGWLSCLNAFRMPEDLPPSLAERQTRYRRRVAQARRPSRRSGKRTSH